jgi:DNA topoisomerase-2
VEENGKITIEDNGRGIPIVLSDGKKTQAEQAFTNLRAGANFDDDGHVSIGTHGLGSTLVNILSKKFVAHTDDGNKYFKLVCKDNMNEIDVSITKSKGKVGTKIEFFPDYDRFNLEGMTKNHFELIEKRVSDLAICFNDIKFKFNGRLVKAKNFKQYLGQVNAVFEAYESERFKIGILPSSSAGSISFVNGIDTFRGGTHVDLVTSTLVNELRDRIKKKWKFDIKPADIKQKLLFVITTNEIADPKFESQTKERLTNNVSEFRHVFDGMVDNAFLNRVVRNEDIIEPIIEAMQLKQMMADARALKKASKRAKKKKIAAHIPATGKNIEDKILFLTEGLSAISNLINVRDPKIHGGYPLRGKVKNVRGMKPTDIMKNEELSNVMNILGLEFGEPATDLNYGRIGILADADFDGFSISALLFNFFSNWKDLFDDGRIVLVRSPIVIAKKGKSVKRFYSLADYKNSSLSEEWKISYNKGLGSLTVDEYEKMINDPKMEVIEYDKEGDKSLVTAFGKDSAPRKTWLMM